MTDLILFQARVAAERLGARVAEVCRALPPAIRDKFLDQLDTSVHDKPLVVLTGQYNSGKSTLITALTDKAVDALAGSDVTTQKSETYDWLQRVDLVDTPGVQAGSAEHDEEAEHALIRADLVIFTATVKLFDDPLTAHLRHVLDDLGKARQTLVVITKASTAAAVDGVRGNEIHRAAGTRHSSVPFRETDAQDYLESLDLHTDDPDRAALRAASGIDELREALNEIAVKEGRTANLAQPFQNVLAVCGGLEEELAADPNQQVALGLIVRQERALVDRRARILARGEGAALNFRRVVSAAAETFADVVDTADELDDSERARTAEAAAATLQMDLDRAARMFAEDISRCVAESMDELSVEMAQIEAMHSAQQFFSASLEQPDDVTVGRVDAPRTASPRSGAIGQTSWAPKAQKALTDISTKWGAGDGTKASAGTFGHQVVLDVGHRFKHKFEPWQAARVADNLGKTMKLASKALPLVMFAAETYGTIAAEDRRATERVHRRNAGVRSILGQAEQITRDAAEDLRSVLNQRFDPSLDQLREARQVIREASTERGGSVRELEAIQQEAVDYLRRLNSAPAVSDDD